MGNPRNTTTKSLLPSVQSIHQFYCCGLWVMCNRVLIQFPMYLLVAYCSVYSVCKKKNNINGFKKQLLSERDRDVNLAR